MGRPKNTTEDVQEFLADFEQTPEARNLHGVRAMLEGLEAQLATANEQNEKLREELRWIPVEERLPQPTEQTHPQQSEFVWLANITENKIEAVKAWCEPSHEIWFDCFGNPATGTHWRPMAIPEGGAK